MRRRNSTGHWCRAAAIAGCCLLRAGTGNAQGRIEVQRLADNIYAAVQPSPNRFDDANSLIVILDDGVLVVDTQVSPTSAAHVLAAIRTITNLPVRWVVNTHWHGDHVQGNQLYREAFPDADFIAHETTGADVETRAVPAHAEDLETIPGWLERAKTALATGQADGQALSAEQLSELRGRIARREAYLENVRAVTSFVLPTRTLRDTLTIAGGRVRLRHFRGHTQGDLIVHVPAAGVLATGDLLDDLPFTGQGAPRELLATLDSIRTMRASVFVPGHGAVRRGADHLEHVQSLFRSIVGQVDSSVRNAKSLEETQAAVDVEEHRSYFVTDEAAARYWPFFISEAVRQAWEEAGAQR
jgi:glyoxylase-like metal-dependent hydrolase (beta-lactamase superfamily II)